MKIQVAILAVLAISLSSSAATLTITPDKGAYAVGETIHLSIVGDPESEFDEQVFGRLVFDSSLATTVTATQSPLTFLGGLEWSLQTLFSGTGFTDAFRQIGPDLLPPVDGPLLASVELLALAPGLADLSWQGDLDFFGLTESPGVSILIVPEPGTAALFALGLAVLSAKARPGNRR